MEIKLGKLCYAHTPLILIDKIQPTISPTYIDLTLAFFFPVNQIRMSLSVRPSLQHHGIWQTLAAGMENKAYEQGRAKCSAEIW